MARAYERYGIQGVPADGINRLCGVEPEDFGRYDYVLAMDLDNLAMLTGRCPAEHAHKVRLFMEFAPEWGSPEVPDPYYGGVTGFEQVFDMVEAAARGLMEDILERL